MMEDCIFCKIVAGEIPASKVYEDREFVVFHDIHPLAKVHLLCVPKEHYAGISELDLSRAFPLGRMLRKLGQILPGMGLSDGYRIVINEGENAGQTVHHLHLHILGGEKLTWEK